MKRILLYAVCTLFVGSLYAQTATLPTLDAATGPLVGTDILLCREGADTVDNKCSVSQLQTAIVDPLTVLGPASVCQAHPFSPNEDGEAYLPVPLLLTETSLMCSLLYMYVEPNQSWAELTSLPGNSLSFFATDAVEGPGLPTPGGKVSISAGNAAPSTDTDGAARGGDLELHAGGSARLNSGDENGGDISLVPGSGVGTGRSGNVVIASGNLTGPSGGFSIIGGTAATDDLILDGSAGTAGSVTISETGAVVVPVGAANAPTFLSTDSDSGIFFSAADLRISKNGTALVGILGTDFFVQNRIDFGAANDAYLVRDGTGVIAQRNTSSAQTFRLYGTGDGGTGIINYERLSLSCDGTADCTIATETAGTGTDDVVLTVKGEGPAGTLILDGSDDVAGSMQITANGRIKGKSGGFIDELSDGNWSFQNSSMGSGTVLVGNILAGAGYDVSLGTYYNGVRIASGKFLNWAATTDANSGTPDTGLARSAAGVVKVTDGSTGIGKLLNARAVTPDIDGETTTAVQSGTVWTNTGDGDGEAITLLNDPGIGVQYCFAVDAAQTITVAPSTGESLYYGTDQCVVSLTSNAVGSTLCVTAVTGGSGAKWMTFSSMGSWTCND